MVKHKKRIPLIQIGNTLISADCLDQCFCCNLKACGGACCVEGDDGAPVTPHEASNIEHALPHILPLLSAKAITTIRSQGITYTDRDGDLVTSLINGKDCVFTHRDSNGCVLCALETAGNNSPENLKPLSCRLYPLRITQMGNYTAVNYHRWNICRPAVTLGTQRAMPLYRFLKQPLTTLFGTQWYDELETTVKELTAQGYLDKLPEPAP